MLNLVQYLDPLIGKIDSIIENNRKIPQQNSEEYGYLTNTLKILALEIKLKQRKLQEIEKQLEELILAVENSTGDDKKEAQSEYNKYYKLAKLEINYINERLINQFDSPYFGKVIFDRKETELFPKGIISSYIGKKAYFDEKTHKVIITDWRAPIANLYYTHSGPTKNASFESPVGIQHGDLIKKVQFDISNGSINNIYDQTTGNSSFDAFLLSNLERRIGKKLQDIISTIQEEQNEIIREKINHPVIVQGVAGSGKTTILLHKISYIAYNYKDKINIENSLIIAPNILFLDYIQDALDTLGVHGIQRNTYLLWAKSCLNWDEKYLLISTNEDDDVKKYKGSINFIKIILEYLKIWEMEVIENIPHPELKGAIRKRFLFLKESFPLLSLSEKLTLALEYSVHSAKYGKNFVSSYFNEQYEPYKIDEIKRYFNKECKSYYVYKKLFDGGYFKMLTDEKIKDGPKKIVEKVYQSTIKTLKKSGGNFQYRSEDVAPILFINTYINTSEKAKYDYILVDEAQDISIFQLFTLYQRCKYGNITITGDLAQSIIPPFYISSWRDVENCLKDEKLISDLGLAIPDISFHNLKKCYRTTIEVIDFTREYLLKILGDNIPFQIPEGLLRHGEEVKFFKHSSDDDQIKKIHEILKYCDEKNDSTTAILCKDYQHADKIFSVLNQFVGKRFIYDYNASDYKAGILVLPIEKAKGLEFDSVILLDAKTKYNTNNVLLDAKLLYVAFTRTLHRLFVFE